MADTDVDGAFEVPSASFGELEALFEKIEDEHVEELNGKLEARMAETESESDESDGDIEKDMGTDTDIDADIDLEPTADDRINFGEFQELDIRVGRIVVAEGIDGADKLVKLTVNIGVEERRIVAGIKQLHDLDSFVGSKVVTVASLEKVGLFGVESNGMLLAASDEVDILATHGDTVSGTRVQQTAAPT